MVLGKTLQPFSPAPGSLFLLYLLFLGASSFRSRVCLVLVFFLFPIYFLIIFFQGTREIRNDPAPWEKKKPLRFTSTLRAVLKCLGLLMLEDWGDFSLFLSRPPPPPRLWDCLLSSACISFLHPSHSVHAVPQRINPGLNRIPLKAGV